MEIFSEFECCPENCNVWAVAVKCFVRINKPRREKTNVLHMRKERRRSLGFVVFAKLISAFVFATKIFQSLYFLNLKFQASSHLL